jgi:hypothetical protein
MKSLLIGAFSLICSLQLAAQQNVTLQVVQVEILQALSREAIKIELVPLVEGAGSIMLEDSLSVQAGISFMQPQLLEGDNSCPVFCKMYIMGANGLLLDVDVHFFHQAHCGFYVLKISEELSYFADMDEGGIALFGQMASYAGYPKY